MIKLFFIALGGSLGALMRYGTTIFAQRFNAGTYPFGTTLANLTGCLLIGMIWEVFDRLTVPSHLPAFIIVGFLGAYTTMSSYGLETLNLIRAGDFRNSFLHIIINNFLGILFVFGGILLTKILFRLLTITVK